VAFTIFKEFIRSIIFYLNGDKAGSSPINRALQQGKYKLICPVLSILGCAYLTPARTSNFF